MNTRTCIACVLSMIASVVAAGGFQIKVTSGEPQVSVVGEDNILVFNEDATVEICGSGTADVLLVAGGGGGGMQAGGGGGGGGVVVCSNLFLQAGTYPVKIGLGGAGAKDYSGNYKSESGGDSQFYGVTAVGGGAGGSRYGKAGNPQTGATGGGAGAPYYAESPTSYAGAPGTLGLGFGGGASTNDFSSRDVLVSRLTSGGGGGGGVGEPGQNAPELGAGGKGGDGIACDFSGATVVYGGGGGGARIGATYFENAGVGGGGRGGGSSGSTSSAYAGEDGVDGLGGGGGGGGGFGDGKGVGGRGGNGVVILRYKIVKAGFSITIR